MHHRKVLAVAPNAHVVAIRQGSGIRLFALDGSAPTATIRVENLVDFGFVAGQLWVIGDEALHRFSVTGAELGPPQRLPAARGELITAADGSGVTALWRSADSTQLLVLKDRHVELEDITAELVEPSFIALLGGRRILSARNGVASIRDIGHTEVASYPLSGRLRVAYSILGGRALAMLVEANGAGRLAIMLAGKLVHELHVPRPDLAAIAYRRGLVAVCSDTTLVFADARLGRISSTTNPPIPVIDLGLDADAEHVLLAGMKDGELELLDVSPNAEPQATVTENTAVAENTAAIDHVRTIASTLPTTNREVSDRTVSDCTVSDRAVSDRDVSDGEVSDCEVRDRAAPHVPFRSFVKSTAPVPESGRQAEIATALLEQAMCHAALLLERLHFLSRNLGLLPRTMSHIDPVGPLVISDSDVATILAGFRMIRQTPPASRPALLEDPFRARIAESRAELRQALGSGRTTEVGLARIVRSFSLSDTALDMLVLTFAPDWDLRLARLCGFLNNDASQQRPVLAHLLMTAQQGLPSFATDALALLRRELLDPGLVELEGAPAGSPLKSRVVRPVDFLVELSSAASLCARFDAKRWDDLCWEKGERERMRSALRREVHRAGERRLILLEGPPGSGRTAMACATAVDVGTGFELCNLAPLEKADITQLERELSRAAYRARLTGAALVVRGDRILAKWSGFLHYLDQLARKLDIACFATVRKNELAAASDHVRFVRFAPPRLEPAERKTLWKESLEARGLFASESTLDDITGRYAITPGRLVELTDELRLRQAWRQTAVVEVGDVRETLRDITVQKLGSAAKRYRSSIGLSDLVLPENVRERLAELVHRLRHRQRVLSGWAFADKAHESFGVSALFSGPAGTGKTAAAVAVANELEIDLYIVDFSGVMSKWVGETEQNLARIFDEAEASSVALLFDEADALFGKRTSDQGSGADRYANLTVNYLLQRMESYSGLAILTTNLEAAMDEAFQRRITTRIKFPPADEAQRRELWLHLIPRGARYGDDVDLGYLSRLLRMEGAHIRRALTRAAFRAAARGQTEPVLTQADLLWAARAEYEDMGRLTFDEQDQSGPD